MARISRDCLQEVEKALKAYLEEINDTDLTESSKRTYGGHANNFVRWIRYEFHPGAYKDGVLPVR